MADRGAEAGGYRLLLDGEKLGFGRVLIYWCIGIDGIEGLEEEGLGRFDHYECWDNAAECVFNLVMSVDVIFVKVVEHTADEAMK
jgi:hypothetical protein